MSRSRLSDLERSLRSLVKTGEIPGSLPVDLDDLLVTSQKLSALLEQLAGEGAELSREELLSRLFHVQIMIEQDLPMILDDLVPPLRTISGESLGRPSPVQPV